jgi:hypothetical protein
LSSFIFQNNRRSQYEKISLFVAADTLLSHKGLLEKWNKLTPLARNEWICWTTIVKQPETRKQHIERLCIEIPEGKKRPCCWPGCPHRNSNAQKWFKGS